MLPIVIGVHHVFSWKKMENDMRTLYLMRVLHTDKESGDIQKAVLEKREATFCKEQSESYGKWIEKEWEAFSRAILTHVCTRSDVINKLHIFADSIPDVADAPIKKGVRELAAKNIPMHVIILTLMERGAHLHGTEDLNLLREERNYAQSVFHGSPPDSQKEKDLLHARDGAIARHIADTVPDGETAMLFIGKAHEVEIKLRDLAPDFTII